MCFGERFKLFVIFIHVHAALGSVDFCIHGGTRYEDGDYFPSNGTVIKTENPQQCVQCRCHEGLVICEVEKCPLLDCESPVRQPEYCCRRCPDAVEGRAASDVTVSTAVGSRKRTGCTSNGKYYRDGSVWQPVAGPLGVMSCVQCACEKGVIACRRFRCREAPCSHPKLEFGRCCPVCPAAAAAAATAEDVREECLPKSAELFVFESGVAAEGEVEYAFVDGGRPVELHAWNLGYRGSENVLVVRRVAREEFAGRSYKLLGATSYRRYRKYAKREERLRRKCFARCANNLARLVKGLKVYAATGRRRCNDDEIDPRQLPVRT